MKSVKLLVCVCLLAIVNLGGGKGCPPPTVPGVDLRVTQIRVEVPESPMWGVEVPVSVVLQNHGTEDFEGSVFGSLFVQSERSEDFQCGGLEPWGIAVDFLQIPAGEEGLFSTSFPLCKPGVYTLTVDLQFIPADLIDENNSMATSVTFEWEEFTDLTYAAFQCSFVENGPEVFCTGAVINAGNTPFFGEEILVDIIMISPDGGSTRFEAGGYIWLVPGSYTVVDALFEEITDQGWYTFVLQIDPKDWVQEDDEANNSISIFMEL